MLLNQVLQLSEQMLELIQSEDGLSQLDRLETLEQQRVALLKQYSDQSGVGELPQSDVEPLQQIGQLSSAVELAAKNIKNGLRTQLIGNRKNQKNIMAYG